MPAGHRPSIAVLIPAHNEACGIAGTSRNVSPQLATCDRLVVIADNCTDGTERIALRVRGRSSAAHRLRASRQKVRAGFWCTAPRARSPEAVLVIDADCCRRWLDRSSRACLRCDRPADAGPGPHALARRRHADDTRRRVRLAGQEPGPPARVSPPRAALSSDGHRNGLSWPVVVSAKFASGNIVEDLELGIDLARAGMPPLFCPEARVTSYFPATTEGIADQRSRWEHGHLGMILRAAPGLLVEGPKTRNRDLLALALSSCVYRRCRY